MPLTKAFLVPHSPILIPEIGKSNRPLLRQTIEAYETLKIRLKEAEVETLIIISPHGSAQENYFSANAFPDPSGDLKKFGLLAPQKKFNTDLLLLDKIRQATTPPLQLLSSEFLDYATTIPLKLLTDDKPLKIISLQIAENLDISAHLDFGRQLGAVLQAQSKKIAVVASGDLSARLKKNSPSGYSPKGTKFDSKIITALDAGDKAAEQLIAIGPKLADAAGQCGLKPLAVLIGTLAGCVFEADILSYQTELGIGYLSADLPIKAYEEPGTVVTGGDSQK
ncbi:MAG: class III extradiol dioxygenase subunit B-like domain-containing protein [Bacilli bacterium]|nr:class III extradiol dioxygenase subunit B-like domain-containing protein [Bacilli bacterium]